MITLKYEIKDPLGFHSRPAAQLVKEAKKYASAISVVFNNKAVDASRMFALMQLGAKKGDSININIEGPDEEQTAKEIEKFIKEIV